MVQWNMGVSPKVVPFQKSHPFPLKHDYWRKSRWNLTILLWRFCLRSICTFQETLTYPTCGKGNIFKHALVTGYVHSDFPSGKAKTLKAHISWWLVWVKVGAKTDCCQDLGTGNEDSILALQSAIGWRLSAGSNREVIEQLLVIFQQGSWKITSKYQEKKQEEQEWLSKDFPSSYFLCIITWNNNR